MMILSAALIALLFASFMIGTFPIMPKAVWDIILSKLIPREAYWEPVM